MNFYLQKYGFLPPQIKSTPDSDTTLIVVIPCYNEPDLIRSLESLESCDPTKGIVEVIIVVNSSEVENDDVLRKNTQTINAFNNWNQEKKLNFELINVPDLPKKHAGVGLARKIGMDEAVARFDQLEKDGVIVCFDADSQCSNNYLAEIERHFEDNLKTPGCSIHFEHPIEGDEFVAEVYSSIVKYELHLRYYKQALQYCELPYAYHTVGSSMAVKSSAYQKQGGMNKRKAGEDFYFIHKIIALGRFTEIVDAKVIPSPRASDRVPFGTGRAVGEMLEKSEDDFLTYNLKSFQEIKQFIGCLGEIYSGIPIEKLPITPLLLQFLVSENFGEKLREIKSNTKDYHSFEKRFFVWFDAFKVLKVVHYLRDHGYRNESVSAAAMKLLKLQNKEFENLADADILLKTYRTLDQKYRS